MRFCRAEFGSTVERQEKTENNSDNSDSDVEPESNQIQDLLMPRNNSRPNSPSEHNLAKIHLYNLWILFGATQKHDVWIAVVPETCCSAAEPVELNCLPHLIQKFDSDAVLLSNLIPEFSSARQKHGVWTGLYKKLEQKTDIVKCLII